MWRRKGVTGTSMPASRPTWAACDLAQLGGDADLLGKALEHRPAQPADPDVHRGRELLADAAGAAAGGAAAELAALEEQRAHPPATEVVGERAADDAAADDHALGGGGEVRAAHAAASVPAGSGRPSRKAPSS